MSSLVFILIVLFVITVSGWLGYHIGHSSGQAAQFVADLAITYNIFQELLAQSEEGPVQPFLVAVTATLETAWRCDPKAALKDFSGLPEVVRKMVASEKETLPKGK